MANEQKQPVLPRLRTVVALRDASYYASPLLGLELVSVVRANFLVPYSFLVWSLATEYPEQRLSRLPVFCPVRAVA